VGDRACAAWWVTRYPFASRQRRQRSAAAFHEFLQSGKRGFVQERRISRRAMLRIVSPADDEASDSDASAHRDAA
jgi:hypothetical protein